MGATVIDQLIVKLGLDPKDFTKGQKAVAESMVKTQQGVEKSTDGIGASFNQLAAKWLTLTALFQGAKWIVGALDDVSERTRRLGIDSKNYGVAAANMRNFENTVEMFGGRAEDARKSIAGFNKSIFDMAYNGQMSDGLAMLARLGVQFQDNKGKARDFKDVVLDTSDAIAKAQKNGMSRAEAFQYLQQSGFDQGTSQLILEGRGAAEAGFADQGKRHQVSDEDFSNATRIQQKKTDVKQTAENAGIAGMAVAVGTAETVTTAYTASVSATSEAMTTLHDKVVSLGDAFENFKAGTFSKGRGAYEDVIQRAAKANNIPPEILAGVLRTESGFNPAAVNKKSGAKGIAQLLPKYFPDAGKNPDDDIRTAAKVLAQNRDQFGGDWDDALMAYNAGAGRLRGSRKAGGKPLAQETLDYPGKVMSEMYQNELSADQAEPTPSAQGGMVTNQTEVQIDNITINTRATDAQGLAEDMDGAVKRKLLTSHAEQGMQ